MVRTRQTNARRTRGGVPLTNKVLGIVAASAFAVAMLGAPVAAESQCGGDTGSGQNGHGIGGFASREPSPRGFDGDMNVTKGTLWPGAAGFCSAQDDWAKNNAT